MTDWPKTGERLVRVSDYDALAARLADALHDIDAYRGALGYAVPASHDGRLSDGTTPICGLCDARHRATDSAEVVRPCTCNPADSPPVPCPRKYALADCRAAGRVDAETFKTEVLACAGDTWECPRCGHSEPWWTESNADYATRVTPTVPEVQP